jgi:hypothetical protein
MDPINDNPTFLMVALFVYFVAKATLDPNVKIEIYFSIAIGIAFIVVLRFI